MLNILLVLKNVDDISASNIQTKLDDSVEQSLLFHYLIKMQDKKILGSKKKGRKNFYKLISKKITGIFD